MLIVIIPALIALLAISCNKEEKGNDPPSCKITSPVSGSNFQQGKTVTVTVDASDTDGKIARVKIYIDGIDVASILDPPYEYQWSTLSSAPGTHTIKASAVDNEGAEEFDSIGIELIEGTGEVTITDSRDGKVYEIIRIGTQWWLAENMNYDAGNGSWIYEDDPSNADIFGRLYDWEAASGVCPDGWHLPDEGEWAILVNFLGGEEVAGGKMKATGTVLWASPNAAATNESRFNALPGGDRDVFGNYYPPGESARFWSSTGYGGDAAFRQLLYDSPGIIKDVNQKEAAMSVRCIKN